MRFGRLQQFIIVCLAIEKLIIEESRFVDLLVTLRVKKQKYWPDRDSGQTRKHMTEMTALTRLQKCTTLNNIGSKIWFYDFTAIKSFTVKKRATLKNAKVSQHSWARRRRNTVVAISAKKSFVAFLGNSTSLMSTWRFRIIFLWLNESSTISEASNNGTLVMSSCVQTPNMYSFLLSGTISAIEKWKNLLFHSWGL